MLRSNLENHNSKNSMLHTQLLLQRHMNSNQQLQDKLFATQKELTETKIMLAESQNELQATQTTLVGSQNELQATQTTLAESQNELQATQTTLAESQNELQATQTTLAETQNELHATKDKLLQSENDLENVRNGLEEMEKALAMSEENLINETPEQIFQSIVSKQPIAMPIIKPINIGKINIDFNKLLIKTFPFKTYEKMELLLSKMNEGQIYNVDEKHLFFKFQFTVTTYRKFFIEFSNHLNRFKNQTHQTHTTQFSNDNLVFQEYFGQGYVVYMQLQEWNNVNSSSFLVNMKDEAEKKFPLQYSWNNNFDFKNFLSQKNEILIYIERK